MYVGQRGFEFEITLTDDAGTPMDVSAASSRKLVFRGPYRARFERDASGTGADGVLRYVTAASDPFAPGTWHVQAVALYDTGADAIGDRVAFQVRARL